MKRFLQLEEEKEVKGFNRFQKGQGRINKLIEFSSNWNTNLANIQTPPIKTIFILPKESFSEPNAVSLHPIERLESKVGLTFTKDSDGHYLCLQSLKKCMKGLEDIKREVLMKYIWKSAGKPFCKKSWDRVLYDV